MFALRLGLDDLCVRFIINLPQEDLSSVARICFQVEEAQWFYEDFIRPLDPTLPSMSLRTFCLRIFQHCPLLASFSVENHMRAFEEFLQYKTRVPVRGAILLNEDMDSTVLVKGWKKGANWSFPRGKINKDEDDLDCAIREVYEETGFDIREAGLVPKHDEIKYIEISMREQQIRLYVFRNVPMDTNFQPRTRKEISKIQWYKLSELPAFRKKGNQQADDAAAASNANKFYMVAPFLVPLKKWVVQQKKKDAARAASGSHAPLHVLQDEVVTEDDIATQAGPAAAGPSTTTADINNLEGATRELQRLLMVQPPTQGIQINPSGPEAAPENADKGGALMAILQNKAADQGHPQFPPGPPQPQHQHQPQSQPPANNTQVPFAPFGPSYYTNPLQSHPPQHQYPHQHFPPNIPYQQPPNFPVTAQMNQNISAAYYNQVRAPGQGPLQHRGHVRNPSNLGPGPQPRKEPVLLHPQPLPPQVQQSRLTRGILATPNLPEAPGSIKMDGSQFTGQQQGAPYGPAQPQPQPHPPTSNIAPPQMTSHSMSLLNALKSGGGRDAGPKPAPTHIPQGPSANANQQNQYQPSWNNAPTSQESQPTELPAPQNPTQPLQSTLSSSITQQSSVFQLAAASAPKPAPPTDKHRSALLDMFKKQAAPSSTGNEAGSGPSGAPSQFSARIGEEAKRSSKPQSPAELNAAARQANGGAVVMNPEVNLPFRAFKILSRPAQGESKPTTTSQRPEVHATSLELPSSPKGSKHMMRPNMLSPRSSGRASPRAGSAGKGGPGRLPSFSNPSGVSPSFNPAQYQGAPASHKSPVFQSATMLHRRQDTNPEQKQKLLSLFGKPQPSPTSVTSDDRGRGSNPSEHAQAGVQRSRVASLASAGGGDVPQPGQVQSRRGSQTPISPADRDFLLGYLQSVTNKTT